MPAKTLDLFLMNLPYEWGDGLTEPPASKSLRLNADTPEAVTRAWLSYLTLISDDLYMVLTRVPTGATLYVQDHDDHTTFIELLVIGPVVDKGSYLEMPVQYVTHSGTVIANKQDILCAFFAPAAAAPVPPTDPPALLPPTIPDVSWVTLEEVKNQVQVTHEWDDATLTALGKQASTAILGYLHPRADQAWTSTTVPSDVKRAVLLLVGLYWVSRGDIPNPPDDETWKAIGLLLARRRDPVIA